MSTAVCSVSPRTPAVLLEAAAGRHIEGTCVSLPFILPASFTKEVRCLPAFSRCARDARAARPNGDARCYLTLTLCSYTFPLCRPDSKRRRSWRRPWRRPWRWAWGALSCEFSRLLLFLVAFPVTFRSPFCSPFCSRFPHISSIFAAWAVIATGRGGARGGGRGGGRQGAFSRKLSRLLLFLVAFQPNQSLCRGTADATGAARGARAGRDASASSPADRKYAGKWLVEVLQLVFGALSVWQHATILKPQRWVRAAGLGRRRRLFSKGRRGAPQGGAYPLPYCTPYL